MTSRYILLFLLATAVVFSSGCVSLVSVQTSNETVCAWDKPDSTGVINVFLSDKTANTSVVAETVLVEKRTFYTPSLGREKRYVIILPPNYYNSSKNYPVVYLLNGMCSNETSMVQYGEIDKIYDALLANGNVSEMIIAMPDGDSSAYKNGCSGSIYYSCGNYEDYIVKDFVGEIESKYRATGKRGIGGVSLGGQGAMMIALKHPGMFSAVTSHSGEYYDLVNSMKEEEWNHVRAANLTIYFDTGNHFIDLFSGFLYSNFKLDQVMNDKNIVHEFHAVTDLTMVEMHSWYFWKKRFGIALEKQCGAIC